MISINLIDEAGVLAPAELSRLKNFVIDKCHCTSEELDWLLSVKVRNDGNAGYSGYWSRRYRRVGADIMDVEAVIVLNSYYLLTVEQMERTLAHEFGHHWTCGYLLDRYEMKMPFTDRAPALYYRVRGLTESQFAKDYSKGWSYCDKEVLAEDYKYHFSPYSDGHRMKSLVGNPTSEVKDYLWKLGKPEWF